MKRILIAVIKFYKKSISPLSKSKCKYYPTCSSYGLEAIETHGVLKGGLLTIWRVIRCNPFSKGGYDPVPLKKEKNKRKK
ncbi:MAG: membrane protein insertion efficiency factor YidD [Oscillospiraceae bacterium]|nr:membrane protein insertion efficiency factor YidD [Oscillospiraceae bacterium]